MKKTTQYTTIAALLGIGSTPLFGAGFQLAERSVSGLGRAFSGEAAIADDAAVMASNPAGMIKLDDSAFSVGLQYINPNVDARGTQFAPPTGALAVGPARDSDVADSAFVPYFYYSRKLSDQLSVGIATFSSFGLATDYSSGFAAQVGTDKSEITTVNINPNLAYRINDQFTVGLGVTAMYAKGRLTNTGGGGTVFDLEGDDWGFGWNIGVLYELSDSTRIGLHYRSSVELTIDGDADLGPPLGLPGTNVDATLEVELPDTVEFSVYHEINDKWAVHADVLWTNWSKFKTLAPETGTPADPALVVQENWEDAFRYSAGVTYKHSEKVTFRAGIALDESPVSTADRTLRIPDGDRFWVSVGATIKLNECYNLDLGYTHIFADDTSIVRKAAGGNEDLFTGKAGGDVDLFGIGISGTF